MGVRGSRHADGSPGSTVRRFLRLYALLAPTFVAAGLAVSALGFATIDLRASAVAIAVVVPAVQALALLVVTGRHGAPSPALGPLLSGPWVRLALGLDAALLGAGLLLTPVAPVGLAAAPSLQPAWIGVKAFAAGALLCVAASRRQTGDRAAPWLLAVALAALGVGLDAALPWLRHLPDQRTILFLPTVLRWLLVYGGLYAGSLWLLASLAHRLEGAEARALDAAGALLFVAALVAVPRFFLAPELTPASRAAVRALLSLAATALFLAAASLARGRPAPR